MLFRSVEVEVDPDTGWLTVPRVWIGHDIGRALNPTLVRGQVEGGVYMGLGEALMEESAFRRLPARLSNALVHKFPSILEYKSLTSLDMPEVKQAFKKAGAKVPSSWVDDRMTFSDNAPPGMKASMLHDLEAGNRLELDWLTGKVVSLGRELGLPTPASEAVYAAVKLHRMGRG